MAKKNSSKTNRDTYAEKEPMGMDRQDRYDELTGGHSQYAITIEEAPVSLRSFFPDYRYRFDGAKAASGDRFLEEFCGFVEANAYLVTDDAPSHLFAEGFARAAAMAALFMDSLELTQPKKQESSNEGEKPMTHT